MEFGAEYKMSCVLGGNTETFKIDRYDSEARVTHHGEQMIQYWLCSWRKMTAFDPRLSQDLHILR